MRDPGLTRPSPGWRVVFFIQRLIGWVAPPLHSLRWKIFALILGGLFLPSIYFLWQVRLNIERSHLISTEQGMIDTALIVADAWQADDSGFPTTLPHTREIRRRVFHDLSPDLRVVIYDGEGQVLTDSEHLLPPGTPSGAADIVKARQGKYGARWEHDVSRDVVMLSCSLPIFDGDQVVGVVNVIKPTSEVLRSIWRSLKNLIWPALLAFVIAVGCAYLLSSYLTRVITDMATRANRIAAGESGVRLETWTKSELGDLARALEAMRIRLEGKAYIEEMASTLSHELKTPLASIRGATEIVAETDDPAVKDKFLGNIRAEVDRLTDIVTNLLALSRIESLPVSEPEACQINEVATEVVEIFRPRAEMLGLTFATHFDPAAETAPLDAEALRRIVTILLDNAFAFTPAGRAVHLETSPHTVIVRDQGCGIAPEIQARIFERFFTTTNPLTGRRGTGLGLAIARSLAVRAGGTIALDHHAEAGTTVTVTFPISPPSAT